MSKVIKLFLLGVSLLSAPAFPMNLGSRLGAMASRVMPRVKAAAQARANRAKAAAQNAKVQAFPTFCRAVNVGIGTAPFVGAGAIATGVAVARKEDTKTILQAFLLKNGLENADESVAAFIRGKLNISVLVAKGSETEENSLSGIRNLTYIEALKTLPILSHADKAINNMIIISSELHAALLSPEMFVNSAEHEKYRAFAQSVIQKIGGSCLENHELLVAGSLVEIALVNHMLGKRVGPIAKRLLKMNPVATTKKSMFGRAVFGGLAKGAATYAGCTAFSSYLVSRADDCINDEYKKNYVHWLYFRNQPVWNNVPEVQALLFRSHPAYDIKRLSGSFDKGAEYVVDAIRENSIDAYHRMKAILAEKTEEEKISLLINHFGYSPDVNTWGCTLSEAIEKTNNEIDVELRFIENNDTQWIEMQKHIARQMEYVTSLPVAINGYMQKLERLKNKEQDEA